MTFEDIEKNLPQGFKDAVLENYEFDMQNLSIKLRFNIWLDQYVGSQGEQWRNGEVIVTNIYFFAISPQLSFIASKDRPRPKLKWNFAVYNLSKVFPENLKADQDFGNKKHSVSSFLFGDEDMFFEMTIAYENADFHWLGDATTRYPVSEDRNNTGGKIQGS